jgi:hypothetical protein
MGGWEDDDAVPSVISDPSKEDCRRGRKGTINAWALRSGQLIAITDSDTYREEGSSHSPDILQFNSSVSGENLSLSGDLAGPLSMGELLAETVPVRVIEKEEHREFLVV